MGRDRSDALAREPRVCAGCGRTITWRRAWADTWHEIRWCSDACRRRGIRPIDHALEAELVRLLEQAPHGGSISPDEAIGAIEAARTVTRGAAAGSAGGPGAQELAEPARRAARRLVAQGQAEIVQNGRVVDASTARGPFQLRRPRSVG